MYISVKNSVEIDVFKDSLFKMENETFLTISVDLKDKGIAKVDHNEAIEPEDLELKCTQACH